MEKICLTNITKTYYENNTIAFTLKKLSLTLTSPMILIIKGASGSGKSTLINLLSGLEKLDSGTIRYYTNDKEVDKLSFGIIFQDYKLFLDQSVNFNISLPLKIKGCFSVKETNRLNELIKKFKLNELKDKKVALLSGGEKQRVAIIRALSTDPSIIIADEPTGSLDFQNGEQVFEILKEISKTKLVIVVTHNEKFALKYADRLIEIRDGLIIKDETKNTFEQLIEDKNTREMRGNNKNYSWLVSVVAKRFIKTKVRLSIIITSIIFCVTFILASLSFLNKAPSKLDELMSNYKNYGIFNISKVIEIQSDNPLFKLTKTTRPEIHEVLSFKKYLTSIETHYSLGAIIDEYICLVNSTEVIDGIRFIPIFDEPTLGYEEVYVNDALADKINMNQSYKVTFLEKVFEKDNILDTFNQTLELKLLGVIKEFKFMNTPALYYNYYAFLELLKTSELTNYTITHNYYTWYDALVEAKNDEMISHYSLLITVNKEQVADLINLIARQDKSIDKQYYQISSFPLDIKRSLEGLLNTLEVVLITFISLSIAGTALIIALFTYSNFYEFAFESAIIIALGGTKLDISSMFIIYNLLVFSLAVFISGGVLLVSQNLINGVISLALTINDLVAINGMFFLKILAYGAAGIILISLVSIILGYKNGLMKVLKEQ